MFWNLFKKTKAEPVVEETQEEELEYNTWISYGISKDSISIDINIEDYSKESLDNFAKLLAGVSTMGFINDTMQVIKSGFENKPEEFDFLMERAAVYAKLELERVLEEGKKLGLNTVRNDSDKPCIKPSEVIR
jgi:hypothetical protein